MNHRLLTLQQTAAILQVPYPRAAGLARLGLIPSIRLGRQVRIDPAQLQRFLAEGGAGVPTDRGGTGMLDSIASVGSAVGPTLIKHQPPVIAMGRRLS